MRVLTLTAAILGCVTLAEAQAPGSELARMNAQISWLFSSGRLQADVIQRGTEATTRYDLTGNVHVIVEKRR